MMTKYCIEYRTLTFSRFGKFWTFYTVLLLQAHTHTRTSLCKHILIHVLSEYHACKSRKGLHALACMHTLCRACKNTSYTLTHTCTHAHTHTSVYAHSYTASHTYTITTHPPSNKPRVHHLSNTCAQAHIHRHTRPLVCFKNTKLPIGMPSVNCFTCIWLGLQNWYDLVVQRALGGQHVVGGGEGWTGVGHSVIHMKALNW